MESIVLFESTRKPVTRETIHRAGPAPGDGQAWGQESHHQPRRSQRRLPISSASPMRPSAPTPRGLASPCLAQRPRSQPCRPKRLQSFPHHLEAPILAGLTPANDRPQEPFGKRIAHRFLGHRGGGGRSGSPKPAAESFVRNTQPLLKRPPLDSNQRPAARRHA